MKTVRSWLTPLLLRLLLPLLLLLHRGRALIPITTVEVGESVSFTCFLPGSKYSIARVNWYKQNIGHNLRLITSLMETTVTPTFQDGFPSSRFNAKCTTLQCDLSILKTVEEDEAVYHCGIVTWMLDQWSGTYLSFRRGRPRETAYTVVQWPAVDPVGPGDPVTLQCSVLSNSDQRPCPGDNSVYWFGVRSEKSFGNIIYTNGNRLDGCDEKVDEGSGPEQKSCVYHFSKNVSSSDAGTYYCAVATCGEILFGNGTKLEGTSVGFFGVDHVQNIIIVVLCAVLAVSVIVIASLIYVIEKISHEDEVSLQENMAKKHFERDGDKWIYSAAVFTVMKTDGGGTRDGTEREKIYAAVKAFGLD